LAEAKPGRTIMAGLPTCKLRQPVTLASFVWAWYENVGRDGERLQD